MRPPLITPQFVLLTATAFTTMTSIGSLLPTLPRYTEGPLGAGSVAVGAVMGAASIAAVVAQPFAGRLGDRRGRKVLLVGGPAIIGIVGLGLLLATSLPSLLSLRLVMGVGEALFFVGGGIVVNDLAPDERRGEAISYYTLSLYAGLALGPLVGELALDERGFDAVWLYAGTAGLVAAALASRVRETHEGGAASVRRRGIVHPAAIAPGVVLLVAMLGFGGFNAFVALYAFELGLDDAAPVFALFAVIVVAVRSVGARIPDRFGPDRTARVALGGLALGLAVIGAWQSALGLYVGTALFALGQSLAFPSLMMLVVRRAPANERGAAVGSFTMFVDLALGLGAIALGGVAAGVGYAGVFVAAACASVAGLVLLLVMGRPSRG